MNSARTRITWGALVWISLLIVLFAATSSRAVHGQEPIDGNAGAGAHAANVHAVSVEMVESIQSTGSVPVIVDLHVQNVQGAAQSEVDVAAIADVQSMFLASVAAHATSNIKTYSHLPALALTVHSEQALQELASNPLVAGIFPDELAWAALDDTTHLILSSQTTLLGYRGQGTAIAILDTGTDKFHPQLTGKVVSEACFSTNSAGASATSLCPGGAPQSVASNSALHCNVTGSQCSHGTHVAAIAAAVAPGANLVPMQVFTRFVDNATNKQCANSGKTSPCVASYSSDQLSALNRVYILRTQVNPIPIIAVNMSLGGGKYNGPCINALPNAYSSIVTSLRNVGVITVVSSGNDGYVDSMSRPACLSNVVSVGATTKNNQMASYSNISPFTTLLAPGSSVTAAIPNNSTATKDGTSMAAPHVAGAFAVLRSTQSGGTVGTLQDELVATGLTIPDHRSGGNNDNKRRINLFAALCERITCDTDDFRSLQAGVARTGNISPSVDRDPYYYYGLAGQRLSIAMTRSSGSFDPYLELYDPNGNFVAANDNGGGGVNALISNHTMQYTGLYTVVGRTASTGTGGYSILATVQASNTNAAPAVSSLSPNVTTANSNASSFWVAISGSNFLPTSQAYWNGLTRITHYTSSSLIYIWVLGSDLGPSPTPPRTAYISVSNPTPGGGYSAFVPFTINAATLGESELVQPLAGSTIETGVKTTFVLSWTVPVTETTWRIMQNMDLRLRDETGRVAASVRVVERPGPDSVYQLLNGAGEPLLTDLEVAVEGIPGAAQDLVITDTITLHMAETSFLGSGLTAIMTPTVTFGPNAVGKWRVEFRVDKTIDDDTAFVQDEDILGTITIADPACALPVESLQINGPDVLQTGFIADYAVDLAPLGASQPLTLTWSPPPLSGQGTPNATYQWTQAGTPMIFVSAQNCGTFTANLKQVSVFTQSAPDLSIGVEAPSVVAAGSPVTYTLVVTNSAELSATNLLVLAQLPSGTTHMGGGSLSGVEVSWPITALGGFAETTLVTMTVAPSAGMTEVVLSTYRVQADGGVNVSGTTTATTSIADATTELDPVNPGQLSYAVSESISTTINTPPGAVADPTLLAVTEVVTPTAVAAGQPNPLRLFRMAMHQNNEPQSPFTLTEPISVSLTYLATPEQATAGGATTGAMLYFWADSEWSSEGITCAPTESTGSSSQVTCVVEGAGAGLYALQPVAEAPVNMVLLPLIQNESSQ